jgi:CheY-like chemotaxis protein
MWADGARLRQALENLFSNAMKFTPAGGTVTLRARRVPGQVRVEVLDTGMGIAPDLLPAIFERFRQGDSSSKRAKPGLGLGLTIAQHIAELHDGRVTAESAGLGQGSRFALELPATSLPLERASAQSAPIRDRPDAGHRLQGVRILLVDDHADTLQGLALALEACGASVNPVSSARKALGELAHRRPDVIVSDIAMPDLDGHDLIREVRRLPSDEGGETPALALSASVSPEDIRLSRSAGYQDQLAKPVDLGDLVAAIERLIARESADGAPGLPAPSGTENIPRPS